MSNGQIVGQYVEFVNKTNEPTRWSRWVSVSEIPDFDKERDVGEGKKYDTLSYDNRQVREIVDTELEEDGSSIWSPIAYQMVTSTYRGTIVAWVYGEGGFGAVVECDDGTFKLPLIEDMAVIGRGND